MTELKSFLVAVYDALSEAEMTALAHGQARRAELRRESTLPPDLPVPVYHADDVTVSLDVELVAEEGEEGTEIRLTESPPERESSFSFTVELFELLEEGDVDEIDYDDVLEGLPSAGAGSGGPSHEEPREEADDDTDDDGSDTNGRGSSSTPTDDTDDDSPGVSAGNPGVETAPTPVDFADEVTAPRPGRSTEDVPERDVPTELEQIEGIGPTLGSRLREQGVETPADLADASAADLAARVETDDYSVSVDRARRWIERAKASEQTAESDEDRG